MKANTKKVLFFAAILLIALLIAALMACNDPLAKVFLPDTLEGDVAVIIPKEGAAVGKPFSASYNGKEPITYKWYKDGQPIPGAIGRNYTPTEPGRYTVGVNLIDHKEKRSDPPIVIGWLQLTGKITVPPVGITGKPVNINYNGPEQDIKYQWIKDGVPVPSPNGTSSVFYPNEPGKYTVTVAAPGFNPITSNEIVVTGAGILTLPGTITITGTGKINEELSVNYHNGLNDDNLSYQWYKDDGLIPYPDGTNSKILPTEEGTYWVQANVPGYNPILSAPVTVSSSGGLAGTIVINGTPKTGQQLSVIYSTDEGIISTDKDYVTTWHRDSASSVPVETAPIFTPYRAGSYIVVLTGQDGRVRELLFTVAYSPGLYQTDSSGNAGGSMVLVLPGNNVDAAVAEVNAKPGAYTLMLDNNVYSSGSALTQPNTQLTIIGMEEPQKITLYEDTSLFTLGNDSDSTLSNINLTIGENIILSGGATARGASLIRVKSNTSLTMLKDSKITAYIGLNNSAVVHVSGSNATFTMKGGHISGNSNIAKRTSANSNEDVGETGGVLVSDNATFIMNDGTIFNNLCEEYGPSDVHVDETSSITLSEGATIGDISLAADTAGNTKKNSTIEFGNGYHPTLRLNINLRGSEKENSVRKVWDTWIGKAVIKQASGSDFIMKRPNFEELLTLNDFQVYAYTGDSEDLNIVDVCYIKDFGTLENNTTSGR